MAIQLRHTLQLRVGMVLDNGKPRVRRVADEIANIESLGLPWTAHMQNKQHRSKRSKYVDLAIEYLHFQGRLVVAKPSSCDSNLERYAANLAACRTVVDPAQLKSYMQMRTRLDLEQAAAVVISAFMTAGRIEDAARLTRETNEILTSSCMWIHPEEPLHHARVDSQGIENIAEKLRRSAARAGIAIPLATSLAELVLLLMRVRRRTPRIRCLVIPQWMFEEAQVPAPAHFQAIWGTEDRAKHPLAEPDKDTIIVSRKHFRVYQRKIFALFQFWKPDMNLRRRIKTLADEVLYGSSWIDSRVFATNNVALLAHYFFAFQRRFQKKVVSTDSGMAFLAKGEGGKIYQNDVSQKSTFEEVLLDIVESANEGVIVVMGADNTLDLIDQTCRLMKEYVDVHGAGKTENLTFKKGESGGSGRGPVDEYNLLCDVLAYLRQQAKEEGIVDVPGPTYKFLAKDIIYWNDGWADDAFAGGGKAGWEEWLEKRDTVDNESWDIVVR
ncbi:hypothetical protein IQ06DRAFT_373922 [Phaeosphaeriaceae sp. SRC1lsM3a]|nr:hypothetical protein IQ06DRAFT_373922 [Stagonospora sp. SRC1lsM3a]